VLSGARRHAPEIRGRVGRVGVAMADFGTVKLYKSSEGYGLITAEQQHI
jgi:hypothetical protein